MMQDYRPSLPVDSLLHRTMDRGVISAIMRAVCWGLHPGSFGEAVIVGDYVDAWGSAHSMLKPYNQYTGNWNYTEKNPISAHILWCNYLPDFIRGSREQFQEWCRHSGYEGASEEEKMIIAVSWETDLFGSFESWFKKGNHLV